MSSLFTLFRQANYLKSLPRTGWLFAGVVQPESLADHTCLVGIYALFLAEAVNTDPAAQGLERALDVGRVVSLALIHDLAESLLTDLSKRSTEALGAEAKHAAEERIIADLLADLPGGARYIDLWREYDAVSTPEARLVKDVDKLEMVIQSVRYAERGHRNLQEFRSGHTWRYPICQRLFDELIGENAE
ncbi:MAG: HD domain-containing protein [Chloroflexi bacterium]|nr:HD domain-containing protein [Chloroflexota bacterium]